MGNGTVNFTFVGSGEVSPVVAVVPAGRQGNLVLYDPTVITLKASSTWSRVPAWFVGHGGFFGASFLGNGQDSMQ